MASFELTSTNCDGHIRALSRAILVASKITREALLEFTPEKLRLCARTDMFLVKFVFNRDFFSEYKCDTRHRCYISLKALLMPFKSSILVSDRDNNFRSQIKIQCSLEDEVYNQLVFKIGADPPAALLTYRLPINDLDPVRMNELNAINRTIDYARVEIAPKQSKKERFLLSAFNSFAPDIDQVTIKASQSEVKFIGSISPLTSSSHTTSEFTHKKDDFSTFIVKEDVNITFPLRSLKLFLSFVETNKVQTFPKYIFEGMGLPAHFIYDASLFKGHFVSSTPTEYIPEYYGDDAYILPITMGPNESFIADENVIQADDNYGEEQNPCLDEEDDLDDDDGYNDNESDCSNELFDANLTNFNPPANSAVNHNYSHHNPNGSIFGNESIRSGISEQVRDPEKVKEIIDDIDRDPDEIENRPIQYSSDSSDDD